MCVQVRCVRQKKTANRLGDTSDEDFSTKHVVPLRIQEKPSFVGNQRLTQDTTTPPGEVHRDSLRTTFVSQWHGPTHQIRTFQIEMWISSEIKRRYLLEF